MNKIEIDDVIRLLTTLKPEKCTWEKYVEFLRKVKESEKTLDEISLLL